MQLGLNIFLIEWLSDEPEKSETAVSLEMLPYLNSYLLAQPPSFFSQNVN